MRVIIILAFFGAACETNRFPCGKCVWDPLFLLMGELISLVIYFVSKIILHANTKGVLLNVVVIKLSTATVFSDQINIARIAGSRYILPDNTPVHAIGWGALRWSGGGSDVFQHVEVNIINHKICTERYAFLKRIPWLTHMPDVTPDMLCTGIPDVGGKDACQGDSGGPIIHNGDVLVGITSWGHRCGFRRYPVVNTRALLHTLIGFTPTL